MLHEQLALAAAGVAVAADGGPAALRADLEQPREAHHPGTEHGTPRRELTLGVAHVAQRRNDEHRLVRDPLPVRAQHASSLSGVCGSRDERERHGPEYTGAAGRREGPSP